MPLPVGVKSTGLPTSSDVNAAVALSKKLLPTVAVASATTRCRYMSLKIRMGLAALVVSVHDVNAVLPALDPVCDALSMTRPLLGDHVQIAASAKPVPAVVSLISTVDPA